MSSSHSRWGDFKDQVLARLIEEKFTSVYGDLQKAKLSGDGWMQACCPFHKDTNPSFGFSPKTGQWACFKGCGKGDVFGFLERRQERSFRDVMLGLGERFDIEPPAGDDADKITYDYTDEAGNLLFQVVKSPGKKFWQRRPDGNDGWINNRNDVDPVLYRLPQLLSHPDDPVYIVEGEKDANRLASLGLVATTSPGGAGKWRKKYATVLTDRDVVILPDNDAPGREHAVQIARSLSGKARSVRIVELPDLPAKGDVSDWLDAGGDRDKLEALVDQARPVSDDDEPVVPDQLPTIETHDRPLRDIYDDAWSVVLAANDPPKVFNSAGLLARLRDMGHGPQIEFLNKESTTGLLARSADWVRTRGDNVLNVKPVKEAADELITTPHADLPKLDAVIHTPIFDDMWKLISEPGYYPKTRLWLHQETGAVPYSVPHDPTEDDVQAALSLLLRDLLVDFPFTADSDRAHAVAAILLPFTRRMFNGPTPIHLIEAPVPGTGKTLLADLIAIIALGVIPGVTTLTRNEEETRKKLTAILSLGPSVISIDNQEGGLASSQVAAAITAEFWQDRILGKSQIVRYPNQALWLVSGNNPNLSMEIARRCVRIRMDAGRERPWERTEFKHPDIREWAKNHRHELVQAVLVLIRHWVVSGDPYGDQTLGSFENWSRTIGGMLKRFGVSGFLEDAEEFYETADPESGEWAAFVATWWETHRDAPLSARDLLQLAQDHDLVGFAYAGKTDRSQLTRFGMKLAGLRDRRFDDYRVVVGKDAHKKVKIFRLVILNKELFE